MDRARLAQRTNAGGQFGSQCYFVNSTIWWVFGARNLRWGLNIEGGYDPKLEVDKVALATVAER